MANTGRPPKPTALKKLQGNPGKRKSNNSEPMPDATMPDCPVWLNVEAKIEWVRCVKVLHACGLLTSIDRAVLAAYCQAWAKWREAELAVEEEGQVLTSLTGGKYLNPNLVASSMASKEMAALAVQLGMTPSARTRIRVEKPPEKPKSLADQLFDAAKKL